MGNGLSLSSYSTYVDHYGAEREPESADGGARPRHTMNFEDIQFIINVKLTTGLQTGSGSWQPRERFLLISTLPTNQQGCLICNTVAASDEETLINNIISGRDDDCEHITVVVYGKNATDETAAVKCNQLKTLGISNVCAYVGGMFEWLLLQDIYGTELFPTTGKCADILEYRPTATLRSGNGGRNLIQ